VPIRAQGTGALIGHQVRLVLGAVLGADVRVMVRTRVGHQPAQSAQQRGLGASAEGQRGDQGQRGGVWGSSVGLTGSA
jgi:hypothetical protein